MVIASWLALPTPSEHATRQAVPVTGEGAGDGTAFPTREQADRASRDQQRSPAPSPSPKPTPSPSAKLTGDAALEAEVITLVNARRAEAGCGAVRYDARLRAAARAHSADMATHEQLSHTGSDGSSPWERAERAGYPDAMSENVAMGYRTPSEVVAAWMRSKGHRDNILNCEAKAVGVGLARDADGTPYWTQLFGRS